MSYPHLYFLLPDGVCYHGHTVSGGKKSGSGPLALKREARELTVKLQARQAALDEMLARLDGPRRRRSSASRRNWSGCARSQQSREKDRVALDHEMRKLGEDLSRANSRLSRGAAGAGAAAPRCREIGRAARAQSRRRRREGAAARGAASRRSKPQRGELEKLEGQAATHRRRARRRCAPNWPAWKNATAASAPPWARLEQQFRETTNRRNAIAPEIERLGEQRARLLADNIELDQRAALLAEQITDAEAQVEPNWPRRTPACAKRCAPARKS